MTPDHIGATSIAAKYLPPGEEADQILSLIRLGVKFRGQQRGKKAELLSKIIFECVKRTGRPYSFNQLLDQLEIESVRRDKSGAKSSCIENVNRPYREVTYYNPGTGVEKTVGYSAIQRHLTKARKILRP